MFDVYLVIGAFAGLMAGLFGIGGGLVIIPALVAIFSHHDTIPAASVMQVAVATSLATVIITAISAIYIHQKHKAIIWSKALTIVPGLAVGAVVGAIIVHFLPSSYLRVIFSVFLVIMSLRMFFSVSPDAVKSMELSTNMTRAGAFIIGILSSILGVGGGSLLVPFLLRCNLDMPKAIGTSIVGGLAVAIVATICFMVPGVASGLHLPWSTGYIYWPAFLGISLASFVFAPLGAMLTHRLPTPLLKRIFAIFLLLMAMDMMFF